MKKEMKILVSEKIQKQCQNSQSESGIKLSSLKNLKVILVKGTDDSRELYYDEMVQREILPSEDSLISFIKDTAEHIEKETGEKPNLQQLLNDATFDFIQLMFEIEEKMLGWKPFIATLGETPKWYNPKGLKLIPMDIWCEQE